MKKIVSIMLVLVTVLSMGTMAFADGTTTLTTTVPPATYTLNIPADQKIEFGEESTNIGNVTVTKSSGFALGKNLQVTMTYNTFSSNEVHTTIPFKVWVRGVSNATSIPKDVMITSGESVTFMGGDNKVGEEALIENVGTTNYYMEGLLVRISSTDWGKALGGDYTATITFTSEVVVE